MWFSLDSYNMRLQTYYFTIATNKPVRLICLVQVWYIVNKSQEKIRKVVTQKKKKSTFSTGYFSKQTQSEPKHTCNVVKSGLNASRANIIPLINCKTLKSTYSLS